MIASIKAFFPYLMVPQDAVEKVEGFIKQLAADQVIIIVRARREHGLTVRYGTHSALLTAKVQD